MSEPFIKNGIEFKDAIKSLDAMKKFGFVGIIPNLSESLFESGFAWAEFLPGHFLFVYRHPSNPGHFDWAWFRDTETWGWAMTDHCRKERQDFLDSTGFGEVPEEWVTEPFPNRVFDLFNFYGALEIMGESYTEGFTIPKD